MLDAFSDLCSSFSFSWFTTLLRVQTHSTGYIVTHLELFSWDSVLKRTFIRHFSTPSSSYQILKQNLL